MRAAMIPHFLPAENHQPHTTTPGDVRRLLARTQLSLEKLADVVEPMTTVQDALFNLRAHEQLSYRITGPTAVVWQATSHCGLSTLTARSSAKLKIQIASHFPETTQGQAP
jgi:hypothetical protein